MILKYEYSLEHFCRENNGCGTFERRNLKYFQASADKQML
jgi:hypothetical protein